jgi:hypothetical protein
MRNAAAVFAAVVVGVTVAGCDATETRTIYLLNCEKPVHGGRCIGPSIAQSPVTVRVFPEAQRVILKAPLHGAYSLGRCEVFDADNWHCRFNDGSGEQGMVDGEHFRYPIREREIQVGMLRFWLTWAVHQFIGV